MSDQTSALLRSAADRSVPPAPFDLEVAVRGGRRRVRRRRAGAVGAVGALAVGALATGTLGLVPGLGEEQAAPPARVTSTVEFPNAKPVWDAIKLSLEGTPFAGDPVAWPHAVYDERGALVGWDSGTGGQLTVQVFREGHLEATILDEGLDTYCLGAERCDSTTVGDARVVRIQNDYEHSAVDPNAPGGTVRQYGASLTVLVARSGASGVTVGVGSSTKESLEDAQAELRLGLEDLERIALDPALRLDD